MNQSAALATALLAASACGGHPPTAPSSAPSPSSTVSAFSSIVRMTGLVREEGNIPVAGVSVTVLLPCLTPDPCTPTPLTVLTDANGSYDLSGDVLGFGAAIAEKTGYEPDDRYIGSSYVSRNEIVANFRLYRVRRLIAGESTTLTVAPGDPECGVDGESVCRTVRIISPSDGTLTVEAIPNDLAMTPGLQLIWPRHLGLCCELTATTRLAAGAEVHLNLLMRWNATVSTSFALKTSFVADRSVNAGH